MLRFDIIAQKAIKVPRSASFSAAPANRGPLAAQSGAVRRVAARGSSVAQTHLPVPAMGTAEKLGSDQAALQVTSPLPGASWGAEVRGIDLRKDPSPAALQQMLAELTRWIPAHRRRDKGSRAFSSLGNDSIS